MSSPKQCSCRVALSMLLAAGLTAHASSAEAPSEPQREFEAQVQQEDWQAAIAAAQELVAAARQQSAQQPLVLAEALSRLGAAHFGNTDYLAAGTAYEEALRIVEEHEGAGSAALIEPLAGVGKSLSMTGRHQEAVPHLERALLLTRRSYGLFDARQRELLGYLVKSQTQLRSPEAERHVVYLLQIAERSFGPDDERMVPWLCEIGNWYGDVGNYQHARTLYRRALEIVEDGLGRDNAAAVRPLRELARSYMEELQRSLAGVKLPIRERIPADADGTTNERRANPRYLNSEGANALERALRILDAQPDPERSALVGTLIDLGDWYQIKDQSEKALTMYRRAAQLVAHRAPAAARGDAPKPVGNPTPLSFPVLVYYPAPLLATRNISLPAEAVDETFVQVEFTVTGSGDVVNARVTDRNGTARQVSETLQAIRSARFRPKFVNGQPVETPGMTNREVFRTRKQDEARQDDASRRET